MARGEAPRASANGIPAPGKTAKSKKLYETGSKVKKGVMSFFRELKDELVADKPGE